MNLSDIQAIESKVIKLVHPLSGEVLKHGDKPFTATVTRLDTPDCKRVQNKYKNAKEAKRVQEEERRYSELFAAATTNITYYDNGEWVDLSEDKDIIALFMNNNTSWIYDQIAEEIGDTGNFLTETNASSTQNVSDTSKEAKGKS